MELEKYIYAHALKNAIEYGKTDAGRILPKLFQNGLEKSKIKETLPKIQQIAKEVNSLSKEKRLEMFKKYEELVPEKEEKEHELPELPNVKKNMIFRLAPFPSGALHIGNAKTYLLNALYAEKYNAKILLVIDDTIGSEEKQIAPEAYKLLEEAFQWLNVKYEKPVIYKSDRLEIYYKYAIELIKKEKAYVCSCSQEKFKELKDSMKECPCRNKSVEEELKLWDKMFSAKQGSCVLRIKTSMSDPNPAFRDRVLFKISDREHPRVKNKYRVWPTLEMSWAFDDHLLGITHILRGDDLVMETEMEKFIWDIFGWEHPETIHVGLVQLEGVGAKISKSKAQKEVRSGEFIGWDDPRTWSIQSLKRRGIKPEAILEFVKSIGLNKQFISIPIEAMYAINRKLIDADANRYFFVKEPVEIKITKAPDVKEIEIPIHPDKKEMKKVKVGKIFIQKEDFENLKGKEIRLLHLFNVKLNKKECNATFTSTENKNVPRIQWVSDGVPVEVLMPDGKWEKGIAESSIKTLKNSEVVQFDRYGFVKLDKEIAEQSLVSKSPRKGKEQFGNKKEPKYQFWFAHK
jgi:glutamyl-tRNA synthetase